MKIILFNNAKNIISFLTHPIVVFYKMNLEC